MAKIVVNAGDVENGEDVEVVHFGVYANGGTYEVSERQVRHYESNGYKFPEDGTLYVGILPKEIVEKAQLEALEFDPNQHTVDEVLAYIESAPDERDAILRAEQAGKSRKSIIEALEES